MNKCMFMHILLCFSLIWGATDLCAESEANHFSLYLSKAHDLECEISRVDEKIAKCDIILEKDSDNKVAQVLKKTLTEKRSSLVLAYKLTLDSWKSGEKLSHAALSGNTTFFLFDAPEGTEAALVDFQAYEYGINFAKEFNKDKAKTLTGILQLNKVVDDLLEEPRYSAVSQNTKTKFKKAITEIEDKLIEMFSKGLAEMKMEYVGIRKSLHNTDWMVFRLAQNIGDLSYLMISYSSNEDKSFRAGRLFAPVGGDYSADLILMPMKKLIDTQLGLTNNLYTIPSSQNTAIFDAFVNGDFKTIVNFFNDHPEHLWKNKSYDGNYINALQMWYSQDGNEEIEKKLKDTVELFRKRYPDNILPDISLLSLYMDKGNKNGYKSCLDHLRKR